MTDYDNTDMNLLAAQVTDRAKQLLGPDVECYSCDAATEIIEELGVFNIAGIGFDACATDEIIRGHSCVPEHDEDDEDDSDCPDTPTGVKTMKITHRAATEDDTRDLPPQLRSGAREVTVATSPKTYDALGIAGIDNNASEDQAIIAVTEISGTDQLLFVFEALDGSGRLTCPVSIVDLERIGGMCSAVAQDPTPIGRFEIPTRKETD